DARGVAAERDGGREEERAARDEILGLPDVGNDLVGRSRRASGEPRERQRRPHELEEPPASDRIGPFGGLLRELAAEHLLEGRGARQLLEALPEAAALERRQALAERREIERCACA